MADLSLKYLLYGEDKSASKSIKGVASTAERTSHVVAGSLGRMGSMVGGEFGDMLTRVSAGVDSAGGHLKGLGPKVAATGAVVAGIGGMLTMAAQKDIEAQNQLTAAVDATGKGYEGFKEDTEKAVQAQEKFGHTADDSKTALRVLTTALGDPKKALGDMSLAANIAAAKHISLSEAAGVVVKMHSGAGKVFKQFGVTIVSTAALTKSLTAATTQHTAAVDRLKHAQTVLSDIEAVDRTHKKLTIGQQIQLRNAHVSVANAQDNLKIKTGTLTAAQDALRKGSDGVKTAMDQVAQKLTGQASASMDSFGGKVTQVRTWLADQAATLGAKYGPALTVAGTAATVFGSLMQVVAARNAAASTAALVHAAAVTADAAATDVATVSAWGFTAALLANPLTWIVVGVMALVAAVYLIATRTTWFQTAWKAATDAIGAAWRFLWNSILQPVIRFILNGFADIATAIGHVLQALGKIPGFGWAKTAGDFLVNAANGARNLADNLHKIKSPDPIQLRYYITTSGTAPTSASGGAGPALRLMAGGHARGTSAFEGGLTWVGEEGPELLSLPRGSAIHSNGNSNSMAAGMGGDVHVHVSGQVYGTTKELAKVVLNGLQQIKGSGTKLGLA